MSCYGQHSNTCVDPMLPVTHIDLHIAHSIKPAAIIKDFQQIFSKKKGLLYIPGGWIQKEFFKEKRCLKTFKTAKKKYL